MNTINIKIAKKDCKIVQFSVRIYVINKLETVVFEKFSFFSAIWMEAMDLSYKKIQQNM
jgi:hypothetical protein